MYIYLFIRFSRKNKGVCRHPPPRTSPPPSPPPETSEVCTRGNRRFRRRAELDDRRACTRSCSSDTDSRCRLHWSRLTGRDYYKGGWRDVRIYSGQGMRRTCMLLYNSASRLAERAREIFFLILYFSPPSSFFLFLSLDLFKNPSPKPIRSSFPLSLLPTCPSKPILPSISSAIYTSRNPVTRREIAPFSQPIPIPFDRPNENVLPPPFPSPLTPITSPRIVNNEIDPNYR